MSQNHIGFQLRMLQNEVVRFIDQRARAEGLDEVTQSNGWILKTLYENQNRDIFRKISKRNAVWPGLRSQAS